MLSRRSQSGIWILVLLAVTLTAWTTITETNRQRHTPFGDFSYLQTGSQCLIDGCDPYDYIALNREAAARHDLKPPIFPMVPVYPTSTLLALLPFAPLPWPLAAHVFNWLAGAATALACCLMAWRLRLRLWDPGALVMLATLVCMPMVYALEFANPTLMSSALLTLACLLLLCTEHLTPGWILLGLSLAIKPQLVAGAALVLLCKRETRVPAIKACALALTFLLTGLLAYRLRLGSFHFLASLRWALWLSAMPGGSSDYANKESFDFLNLQTSFGAVPHITRALVNALAWLSTILLAAVACWSVFRSKALSHRPWTVLALALAISLLPVYHRGYDRCIALMFIPASVEIANSRRALAWLYTIAVTTWIANDTVTNYVVKRWRFAPQNPVEGAVFCLLLLASLWLTPKECEA